MIHAWVHVTGSSAHFTLDPGSQPRVLGWLHIVMDLLASSFIDPIVDFNPVVTPTSIATVAPNLYYLGEWNTGKLIFVRGLACNRSRQSV